MSKRKAKKMQPAKQQPTEADKIRNRVTERTRAGLTSATPERLIRAGEDGYEHTQTNVQRITEAPLDRLRKTGFLTTAEFDAGDRYRADAYLAAIDPAALTVDWSSAGGGGRSARVPSVFSSQTIMDARRRHREISARAASIVGRVAFLALVREHTLGEIGRIMFGYRDRKDADVAGRVAVRMACAALSDLYRT